MAHQHNAVLASKAYDSPAARGEDSARRLAGSENKGIRGHDPAPGAVHCRLSVVGLEHAPIGREGGNRQVILQAQAQTTFSKTAELMQRKFKRGSSSPAYSCANPRHLSGYDAAWASPVAVADRI